MSNSKKKLEVIYLPYIHKWGKITNLAGLLLGFLPVLYLGIFYGWWPEAGPVISGWLSIAGIVGISWVMQPIQFFPILGVAGTYMSNISGQISNMRVPCSIAAEQAAGVEPGTPEAEICANIGSAISTFINIAILAVGVIGGAAALAALPESISGSMNYMLPALMGACFIMVSWGQPKMIPLGLGVAILVRVLFTYVFSGLSGFIDIVSIFGTIAVALLLTKKNVWLKNE